jgi:hypothetical protein
MNKIKRFTEFLKKIFWKIGENPLPTFFILLILALSIGGLIFHRYSFLAEKKEPQITERKIQFKEDLYQKILEEWEIRQKEFEEADSREYRDLFKIQVPEKLTE